MVAVGAARFGIVKRSSAHKDKCRPLFRLAEHIRPASGAKTPVHGRPTVGLAHVIGQRTGNIDVLRAEEGANRSRSSAEILADAAPAIACAERRLRLDLVPHRPAQTSARDRQRKTLRPFRATHMRNHKRSPATGDASWLALRACPPRSRLRTAPSRTTKMVRTGSQFAGGDGSGRPPAPYDVDGNEERSES